MQEVNTLIKEMHLHTTHVCRMFEQWMHVACTCNPSRSPW